MTKTIPDIITLELGERSYDIVVGDSLLENAAGYIEKIISRRVFIITDSNVAKIHLPILQDSLMTAGIETHAIILPAGEQTKSLVELEGLINKIFEHKPERKDTLIALGGGVIGDITGFAASILLRGVDFIQIPTTLLAQVDSSVGGKTGINNSFGKNLIGSFYQPKLVLADMDLLKTLPQREFLAGYAEVVKYGLINDERFFDWLDTNSTVILKKESNILRHAVLTSCRAKAEIVAEDEREGGARALLNLGHTFGHALEKEMGYTNKLLHGEAVAVGMVMAFAFSAQLGLCSPSDAERVKEHLQVMGLPVSPYDIRPDWDVDKLIEYMEQDKKVSDGKMVFILARGIGKSFVAKDIEAKDVEVFLHHFLGR